MKTKFISALLLSIWSMAACQKTDSPLAPLLEIVKRDVALPYEIPVYNSYDEDAPMLSGKAVGTLYNALHRQLPLQAYDGQDEYWRKAGITLWGIADVDTLNLDTASTKMPVPQLLYENDKFVLLLMSGMFHSSLLATLSKKDGKFINGIGAGQIMGNSYGSIIRSTLVSKELIVTIKEEGYMSGSEEYEFKVVYEIDDEGKWKLAERSYKIGNLTPPPLSYTDIENDEDDDSQEEEALIERGENESVQQLGERIAPVIDDTAVPYIEHPVVEGVFANDRKNIVLICKTNPEKRIPDTWVLMQSESNPRLYKKYVLPYGDKTLFSKYADSRSKVKILAVFFHHVYGDQARELCIMVEGENEFFTEIYHWNEIEERFEHLPAISRSLNGVNTVAEAKKQLKASYE